MLNISSTNEKNDQQDDIIVLHEDPDPCNQYCNPSLMFWGLGLQNTSAIQQHLFQASRMIFSNLRSLCITPLAWQYATPDQNTLHRSGILVAKDRCFCPKSSECYKNFVHPWDKFHWMFVVCRFQRFSAFFPRKKGSHHQSIELHHPTFPKTSKTFTFRRLRKLVGRPQPPTLRAIASVRHRTFPRLPTNRHLINVNVSWIFSLCVQGGNGFRGFTCFMGKPTPPKKKTQEIPWENQRSPNLEVSPWWDTKILSFAFFGVTVIPQAP